MKEKGLFITLVLGLSLTVALLWALGSEGPPAWRRRPAPESGADWDGLSVGVPTVISGRRHVPDVVPGQRYHLLRLVDTPWGTPNRRTGVTWQNTPATRSSSPANPASGTAPIAARSP